MRYLLVLLAFLCLGNRVRANEDIWLNAENLQNGSYFAPKLRVTHINDSLAFWPGASIGWIIGSVITFGFEGYVLANNLNSEGPDDSRFSMAVGGVVLEPGVGLEFTLTRNIQLCPGVSYLWVNGDVTGVDSKWLVSETAFNLTLRFKKADEG